MRAPMNDHGSTPVCRHFQRASEILAKRWSPQVVKVLLSGPSRYSDLKAAIPQISDHLLAGRLKELELEGIVVREVTPSTPVRIDYRLTEKGRDLAGVMTELQAWAERWQDPEGVAASRRRRKGD